MNLQATHPIGESGHQRRRSGFTLLELLATVAITAIIILVLLPTLTSPPTRSARINCVNNLKNVGLGFRTFAVDYDGKYPWMSFETNVGYRLPPIGIPATATNNVFALFSTISNELSTPKILLCPSDSRPSLTTKTWSYCYSLGTNSAKIPSYFIGLGASEEQPQSILAGDRNLTVLSAGLDFLTRANYNRITTVTTNDMAIPGTNNVAWTAQIHVNAGNILLGDGSVQQCSNGRLGEYLKDAFKAANTNQFGLLYPSLEN